MKFALLLFIATTSSTYALDLTGFIACVAGTASSCSLDSGVWDVSSTISIERSNVTLTTSGDATLRRASGFHDPIIGHNGSAHTNIRLENIKFDGNRYAVTMSGGTLGCAPVNDALAEINFTGVGQVAVANINVIRSVSHSIIIEGSYSSVTTSDFGWSSNSDPTLGARNTAIILRGQGSVASYNRVAYSGGAGISLESTLQVAYGNTLYKNRYEMTDGVGGGQIYINATVNATAVAANTIDGGYWHRDSVYDSSKTTVNTCTAVSGHPLSHSSYPHGIEGSGSQHQYYNNHILQNLGFGMLIRKQESGYNSTPTTDTVISTENPWVANQPRTFVELNAGCTTLTTCFSGVGFPVGGIVLATTTGPINDVNFNSVRVRNNAAPGIYLDSLGWTGASAAGFFPSPTTPNTCVIGSGTQFQTVSGTNNRYKAYTTGTYIAMTTGTAACPNSGDGTY
jgi:hypothetical protein